MHTRSNSAIAMSLLVFFTLPVLCCSAFSWVGFEADTPAGWDFHQRTGDIARNNTVDLSDMSVIAQQWLAGGCSGTNQWCGKADIDASGSVDLVDYAKLANNWGTSAGEGVLLQTIYGTSQDASGTITANTYVALTAFRGSAMAFRVPSNTTLDEGRFKLRGLKATYPIEVKFYNVTGKGYLTSGHIMSRSDPAAGSTALMDYKVTPPLIIPSHTEGTDTTAYSDMVIHFGPMDVNAGDYLLVFDTVYTKVATSCSMIKGAGATVAAAMGTYPDGTVLPKRATVTASATTGNTYYYILTDSAIANYTQTSDLLAFQITTANKTPIVDAGTNQTIVWPANSVNLSGTASDDGLPTPPAAVTVQWTKQSGPGIVTFGSENALASTAILSLPGTYVLRLTATDGQLASYDEVTVTCTSPNQAPAVYAGKDKTIVNPRNSWNLTGTVTDDGLPNPPAAVTTQWTQQSGPGTVIFNDASALSTTATFPVYGVYVLRLTASDGEFDNHDDVVITYLEFPPPNSAPVVSAGMDKPVTLPAMASLNGAVTDDNLPDPPEAVTTLWTQQSGPGTVVFTDASSAVTTASFSQAGTYVLRLTANDGDLASFDEVTITVLPAVSETVYHVTNLNDSGTGSLRDCVNSANTDGVRSRIVFDVGGTINLGTTIVLSEPNTTICATQAPSLVTINCGNICSAFSVNANNGSFGHRFCNLHIRNTKTNWDGIALSGGQTNVTVERCTFTLCRDEGIGMSNAFGNTIAFSRFDNCGSQPNDGTGFANGRGILVTGGSALVIGCSISQCNRGITINGGGFMECRNTRLDESWSVASGSGFTNAGGSSVYTNVIDCSANNNPCSGFRWKTPCHFYRSGNSGVGNCWNWLSIVPPYQWLECADDGAVEHTTPITGADTSSFIPMPIWLIENLTTPATPSDVGQGTGPCQCIVAR